MTAQYTTRQVRRAQAQLGALGLVTTAASVGLLELSPPAALATGGATGLLLGSTLACGSLAHHQHYFSSARCFRRELGDPEGWLDREDLAQTAGAAAVRRHGQRRDPIPADHAARRDDTRPVTAHGWCAGRLVSGGRRLRGTPVYSPWDRGFGLLGPQGSGKTQYLVNVVLDAPGAVLATSTKPELAKATMALRALLGPVLVFNPAGLGDLASTLAWDPVSGSIDQRVADARAWALVRGGGGAAGIDRADFWAHKAQEIIRCYLMAAALAGYDMAAVMHWAHHPDEPTPVTILSAHPSQVPAGWVGTLRTHLNASEATRTGYYATVTTCVSFMDNPLVAAACRPRPGESFDVARFLKQRGTLYLVGGAADRRLAPLLTALTEHVFDQAQRLAATTPGGQLPAPLAVLLDEVANITPVPLDRWAADSRGWGITVGAVVQSLAQFTTTWGAARAEVIWENLPTKVVLPGVSNTEDLRALSYLAGERTITKVSHSTGRHGGSTSTHLEREPVIPGHTIANLPRWHAFILGLGRHPALVRYQPGYQRVAREQAALAERRREQATSSAAPASPA